MAELDFELETACQKSVVAGSAYSVEQRSPVIAELTCTAL